MSDIFLLARGVILSTGTSLGVLGALLAGIVIFVAISGVDFGMESITGYASYGDGTSADCGAYVNENSNLTGDIVNCSGTGLYINNSNITLDCGGHLIHSDGVATGWSSLGMYAGGGSRNNVTIKNDKSIIQ